MLLAERRKKRRNERLIAAYVSMIGQALEGARFAIENGQAGAAGLVDAARQRLLDLNKDRQAEPALVLLILREFAKAKLSAGPELRDLMENLAAQAAASTPGIPDAKAVDAHLGDLVREMAAILSSFIAAPRNGGGLPGRSSRGDGRRAAPGRRGGGTGSVSGWLPDASASVRNSTVSEIERAASMGGVSESCSGG